MPRGNQSAGRGKPTPNRGHAARSGRARRDAPAPKAGGQRPAQRRSNRPADQAQASYQRRRPTDEYIEGRRAVMEALEAGVPLKGLMVADHLDVEERAITNVLKAAQTAGVPARTVSRTLLDQLSAHGAHQGVIAEARPYRYQEVEQIIAAAEGQDNALVVICDHVTDPGNLGAIARSAEVVGAAGLIIPNRRAAQVTATAYKASAGALAYLPVAKVANLAASVKQLQEAGFWVAGASEHATTDVWHAPLEGRLALVLGSEGEGLSELIRKRCDFLVSLPQRGRIESLNVAQSGTALMYEWLRRAMAQREA